MTSADRAAGFGPLEGSTMAMLTTFGAGGEGVDTPMVLALAGDRAYFVTPSDSGKVGRLAGTARVTLAPCTIRGKVTGEAVYGRARRLGREERRAAASGLLRPGRPLFWSLVAYRLQGRAMELFEVVPDAAAGPQGGSVTSTG
jgi:PPOX class probable F420-dependent enzyme